MFLTANNYIKAVNTLNGVTVAIMSIYIMIHYEM